ncbi:hypothetical protein K466DRAFT_103605 [Polyporus arcularius HHB13444]|uniref:Uncharacterized protein n=1 Tax=Polyporus arcularius HHB13444 TaxID=1314778 RepID=A0A5C3PEB3_9APHY|nr:hypothetical protein K466DRAFT_103605 [Polyporus arcularius HHB13444]
MSTSTIDHDGGRNASLLFLRTFSHKRADKIRKDNPPPSKDNIRSSTLTTYPDLPSNWKSIDYYYARGWPTTDERYEMVMAFVLRSSDSSIGKATAQYARFWDGSASLKTLGRIRHINTFYTANEGECTVEAQPEKLHPYLTEDGSGRQCLHEGSLHAEAAHVAGLF